MYAMIFDDKQNFVWSEVPDPVRKEGEVLIDVHAAAVNRADLMQKDGCYASPPDWPQWCGLEVSGVVLEAPADAAVKPGDKVVYSKYSGTEVEIEEEKYLIVKQSDILAVIE